MRFAVIAVLLGVISAGAQVRKVDLRHTYHRLVCVVPLVGAGTPADPRRPEYAPVPGQNAERSRSGIIAFGFVPSDDGKYALVEFVAQDRAAFNAILEDKRADIKAFDKHNSKRDDIEKELKRYRKNFNLDDLRVVAP